MGLLGTLGRPPGHGGGSSWIASGFLRGRKAQREDPWRGCDHLGASLGRLGGPWGGAQKATVIIGPAPGTSANGLWPPPKL